jgi:hypothetical protein
MIIAVLGVVGLCVGLAVGAGRPLGTFLAILGSLSIFSGLVIVAASSAFQPRTSQLSPENRSRLIDYLKVSRLIRSVFQLVAGLALIVLGVFEVLVNQAFGWIILGFGAFLVLVGAGNAWLARRLSRPVVPAGESPNADAAD